jgi:ferredoxin-type protein NapH
MKFRSKLILSFSVFIFIVTLLSVIQLKSEQPLLLAERFIRNGGWVELVIIGFYGAFVAWKMADPNNFPRWRILTWSIFSIVFFSQLFLGIVFSEKFLMTGKLHLPVPAMILCGPIYRGQLSVMTILFLSTLMLTGPAWCSHLCYFGAIDANFARRKTQRGKIRHKMPMKHSLILAVILITLILRILRINTVISTATGLIFGLTGLVITFNWSRKRGKMMHCILYCPIGTLVNYLKYLNPFRMHIDANCSFCASCSQVCRYDALTLTDLANKKPGITCTYCGDCLSACQVSSLYYKLFRLKPKISRIIYLFFTISIHAVFLALARI